MHTEGEEQPEVIQQLVVRKIYNQICSRPDSFCNYLEGAIPQWGADTKLIYRHYATLYFVFAVSHLESDLGILDLIQVFVEARVRRVRLLPRRARARRRGARRLDKCFENVCELDLIFHSDRVHYILDEIVMAGMVLDTNINNVLKATRDMTKLHQKSLSKLNDLVQSSPSRLSPSQRAAGHQGGSPF